MISAGDLTTPAPTEMAQTQVFKLKTTRPRDQIISPTGKRSLAAPRKYARKKSQRGSSNLKENKEHARKLSGGSGKPKHGKPREKSRLLDSPFKSQPASPALSIVSAVSSENIFNPKRTLVDTYRNNVLPTLSKRRHSGSSTLSLPNVKLLPTPIPLGRDTTPPSSTLPRMPSHPVFRSDQSPRKRSSFAPAHALGYINFNRPPSQLSLYNGAEIDDYSTPVKGLHFSDDAHDMFIAGLGQAIVSTPFKLNAKLAEDCRTGMIETNEGPRQLGILPLEPAFGSEEHGSDAGSESMSMTSVEDAVQLHRDVSGPSGWITDSLISPPTMYLTKAATRCSPDSIISETVADITLRADSPQRQGPLFGRAEPLPRPDVPGRARSGTITQRSHTAAFKDRALITAWESGTRTRSNTIRPVVTTTTPSGALIGHWSRQSDAAARLEHEELMIAPNVHEDADAGFDPNPEDALVFSSARNPDVEDDIDDDASLNPALCVNASARRRENVLTREESDSCPLSSDTDPLNLGREPPLCSTILNLGDRNSATSGKGKKSATRMRGTKLRWTRPRDKQTQDMGDRKQTKSAPPKATRLKKALELVAMGRGGSTSQSRFEENGNSHSRSGSRSPSTDPIDFLTRPCDERGASVPTPTRSPRTRSSRNESKERRAASRKGTRAHL